MNFIRLRLLLIPLLLFPVTACAPLMREHIKCIHKNTDKEVCLVSKNEALIQRTSIKERLTVSTPFALVGSVYEMTPAIRQLNAEITVQVSVPTGNKGTLKVYMQANQGESWQPVRASLQDGFITFQPLLLFRLALGRAMECKNGEKAACPRQPGYCTTGVKTCQQGSWGPCKGAFKKEKEVCDGKDNDCNGKVDEIGCNCLDGKTRPCGTNTGECKQGIQSCTDGQWGTCVGEVKPGAEVCDGFDNDCNGKVDEISCDCKHGTKKPCGTNTGECKQGIQSCYRGKWLHCVGNIAPQKEVCDGKDNDCNGKVDETGCQCSAGETRVCGGTNVGECKTGVQTCKAGNWGACLGYIDPKPEVCDKKDNDCNGKVDDNCRCVEGSTRACGTNKGECQMGTETCIGGVWSYCAGAIQPRGEICDGKDNDCDGQVDEVNCQCKIGDTRSCGGSNVGECKAGTQSCYKGSWGVCIGKVSPTTEVCIDKKDNDCDGKIDENCDCNHGDKQICGSASNIGACRKGTKTCVQGKWSPCLGEVLPSVEICDKKDNDCDGKVDESCTAAACSFPARLPVYTYQKPLQRTGKVCARWADCMGKFNFVQEEGFKGAVLLGDAGRYVVFKDIKSVQVAAVIGSSYKPYSITESIWKLDLLTGQKTQLQSFSTSSYNAGSTRGGTYFVDPNQGTRNRQGNLLVSPHYAILQQPTTATIRTFGFSGHSNIHGSSTTTVRLGINRENIIRYTHQLALGSTKYFWSLYNVATGKSHSTIRWDYNSPGMETEKIEVLGAALGGTQLVFLYSLRGVTSLRLSSGASKGVPLSISGLNYPIKMYSLSLDGNVLALYDSKNKLHILDLKLKKVVRSLVMSDIAAFRLSQKGLKLYFTTHQNNVAKVIELLVSTGVQKTLYKESGATFGQLSFSNTLRYLAVEKGTTSSLVWDLQTSAAKTFATPFYKRSLSTLSGLAQTSYLGFREKDTQVFGTGGSWNLKTGKSYNFQVPYPAYLSRKGNHYVTDSQVYNCNATGQTSTVKEVCGNKTDDNMDGRVDENCP